MVKTKVCNTCGESKPLADFHRSAKAKDKHQYHCKECDKAHGKAYTKRHNVVAALRKRLWREKNKEAVRERRLVRLYSLTSEQYDLILWNQGGVCAICKKPPSGNRKLAVDHNHTTGKVRGLLCDKCNVWLVAAIEDPNFETALAYIRKYGM